MTFIKQYLLYFKIAGAAILLALVTWVAVSAYGWAYRNGERSAQLTCMAQKAELAEAALADVLAARAKEQAAVKRVAQIADKYEQDKSNAQAAADRLIADLRAGNRRLHDRWQAAIATDSLSDAATAAGRADAAQRDREASAARAIAAADQCDAQVAGLQEVVRSDREATP